MIAISIFSSSILLHRANTLSVYFAVICLAVGLYPLWNIIKCNRAVQMIDKGLASYKVQEEKAKK